MLNSLVAFNTPTNNFGIITDAGHNLSSDGSCAFTNTGSVNNTDPKLGPLADNGGPTWTMALLPGSPAIGAADSAGAPPTDQRGVVRPQGPGVDIGAFEYEYIPMFTSITVNSQTNCSLHVVGLLPNESYTLQVSSNLFYWSDLSNIVANSNGVCEFADCVDRNARFYRLKSVAP